ERVQIDAVHLRALRGEGAEADEDAGQGVAVHRGLAAKFLEQRSRPEPADHAPRLGEGERSGGEGDVADGLRADAAPPEHDAPTGGSRTDPAISSRRPRTCSATRTSTAPSSGRASARSSADAARTAVASATPSRTRSRSVLCAIESPQSFTTTGKPSVSAARAAASGPAATASRATGIP